VFEIVRASFDARSWRHPPDARVSVVDFLSTVHFTSSALTSVCARAEEGGEAAVTAAGKPPNLDHPEAADAPKRVAAHEPSRPAQKQKKQKQKAYVLIHIQLANQACLQLASRK